MDDDDVFGRSSGEARDDISILPKAVAIKVYSPGRFRFTTVENMAIFEIDLMSS